MKNIRLFDVNFGNTHSLFTNLKQSFIMAVIGIRLVSLERDERMEPINVKIIQKAQQGDDTAFQAIYDQCHKHVYTYALHLAKNDADAKDVTQETFLQVYHSLHKLKQPEAFPLWLNRIVYSKFQRCLGKKKEAAVESEQLTYHIDKSEKAKKTNDTYLLDDKEIIRRMINQLSDKQREAIQYMYYDQYTISEIAKRLSLPEGTVKSRIFEAKKALQKQITQFERTEHRKIILHNDTLIPLVSMSLFAKIKDYLRYCSISQKLLAASAASMVLVSAVASAQSMAYIHQMKEPEILPKTAFHPVQYHQTTVDNAKSAYYILMQWAADASHVARKSAEEKREVATVIKELESSHSPYYDLLMSQGWLSAYQEGLE